jgi:hypothetical protein
MQRVAVQLIRDACQATRGAALLVVVCPCSVRLLIHSQKFGQVLPGTSLTAGQQFPAISLVGSGNKLRLTALHWYLIIAHPVSIGGAGGIGLGHWSYIDLVLHPATQTTP